MTLSTYGIAVGAVLLLKLLLSLKPRRQRSDRSSMDATSGFLIHGVITVHNEDPVVFRDCLRSIIGQKRRPNSLTVIDDASKTDEAADVLRAMESAFVEAGIDLNFIRFEKNRGKREGLAAGFRSRPEADIYFCVDSDTVLDPSALAEAADPFRSRRVHAVTGLVLANNRAKNLLTRLIDMRYQNAFLGERVAYSRLGSVLCACGSLALYRGWVVRKHLDDFLTQRFLGKPCTFGDDRRLTYYCLVEGKSLIVPTALAWTDVPERVRHFLRQQNRWTKSFIRESVLLLLKFRVLRTYWWLNFLELATWIAFTSALIVALVIVAMSQYGLVIFMWYVTYVCGAAWVRSVHYLRSAGDVPYRERLGTFLAAPLYALMNLFLLVPLRIWALATLRVTKWGTRGDGAEIDRGEPVVVPVQRHDETVPLRVVRQRGPKHAKPVQAKLLDPYAETTTELEFERLRGSNTT